MHDIGHGLMFQSDFFTYCTRLSPIERKGLGELSSVMHVAEGETICRTGEVSDSLYIINRGAVEVLHEDARFNSETVVTYLSRGDVFGEMGVLTNSARKNGIRACEPVSLQVFQKKDFPELIKRVPSFFFYLSQQLAHRLIQVSDMAFIQSNCLELSGSLTNFDLVTIYQTVLNSSQTGELTIFNESKETIASFFFEEGQPRWGRYQHLTGEEAFWQLFLAERQPGTFTFTIVDASRAAAIEGAPIDRHPTDLLITALQYRDEHKMIIETIPSMDTLVKRAKLNLDMDDEFDKGLYPVAEEIWQNCYSSVYTINQIVQSLAFCELKICKALEYLLRTGHFEVVTSNPTDSVPVRLSPSLHSSR